MGKNTKLFAVTKTTTHAEAMELSNEIKLFKDKEEALEQFKEECLMAKGDFDVGGIPEVEEYSNNQEKFEYTYEIYEDQYKSQNRTIIKVFEIEVL